MPLICMELFLDKIKAKDVQQQSQEVVTALVLKTKVTMHMHVLERLIVTLPSQCTFKAFVFQGEFFLDIAIRVAVGFNPRKTFFIGMTSSFCNLFHKPFTIK